MRGSGLPVSVIFTETAYTKSGIGAAKNYLTVGKLGLNFEKEMQTRILLLDFHKREFCLILYAVNENVAAGAIEAAHSVYVLFELTAAHECGKGVLVKV